MTRPPLRFGFHDFINAQPVLQPLLKDAESAGLRMVLAPPATLAARLKRGELDLAMIPSIEYLRDADTYRLVPHVCIASRGAVGSVLLVTKKPLDKIKTIAVDNRSRTSVTLLRILFERRLLSDATFIPADPDPDWMLTEHDAALVIGDQAFLIDEHHPELTVFDLSEEWFQKTRKPFVHAVIAVRPEVRMEPEQLECIQNAPQKGVQLVDEISASEKARKSGLTPERCKKYLLHQIVYRLDDEELEGLAHFRDICSHGKIIPHQHPIEFV